MPIIIRPDKSGNDKGKLKVGPELFSNDAKSKQSILPWPLVTKQVKPQPKISSNSTKRKCLAKQACIDFQQQYGARIFPVCPVLQRIINRKKETVAG